MIRDINVVVNFEETDQSQHSHHPKIVLAVFAQQTQPRSSVPLARDIFHLKAAAGLCPERKDHANVNGQHISSGVPLMWIEALSKLILAKQE
jgi:hypothetical protein